VDDLWKGFLPGTAFARDQNAQISGGHLPGKVNGPLESAVGPDDSEALLYLLYIHTVL
jgi:hypothetical protein